MDFRSVGLVAFLTSSITSADAADWAGVNDPKFCYALDLVLLLYCVVITALLLREKFCKPKAKDGPDTNSFEPRRQRNDLETGATRQNHRQAGEEVYTRLQKPNMETYNQIHVKPERRRNKNEQVYEGLSAATKDTYESLRMQPILPPR
ncbi:hypothetical protein GJAV_G00259690 [Gymnothorax javanicus]|nr:hypothetical protein GJAV_G00259690 [Gymnothorax javanicus]